MRPALLLLDLRWELLRRPGLVPRPAYLVESAERLLRAFRDSGALVLHGRGLDDSCPASLAPVTGETVFAVPFSDAGSHVALTAALPSAGVDTLVLAGLFLHDRIRATALSARERGYQVWLVDDAVGSDEPEHAELTRLYLADRGITFLDLPSLLTRLGPAPSAPAPAPLPAAWIGRSVLRSDTNWLERRDPSDWGRTVARVALAGAEEVDQAAEGVAVAQRAWQRRSADERRAVLETWADLLTEQATELTALLVEEIGKPLADSQGEVRRAAALARTAARLLTEHDDVPIGAVGSLRARGRPCGVIGLITPWNNPLALAVGKIAPALALGNGAVWKPAVEAPRTALTLLDALHRAGAPLGLVNLVFGQAATARQVVCHPQVAAVSLTGSIFSGRCVALHCSRLGKPLQAELGGNNAAIVWPGADLDGEARRWALAAFTFAGQRCTALRRFIVHTAMLPQFRDAFVAAVQSLRLGDPRDPATEIGPLISRNARAQVCDVLDHVVAEGGRVLCGGQEPSGLTAGCWLEPAVVVDVPPSARVVREETFGPVAVLLPADDLEEAIARANGVEQGLVASFSGGDEADRERFAEAVEAGILQFAPGMLDVHPEAPFGGWKASGFGPPEHGVWDRFFYARTQAVYGRVER